jgi:hypothetical protein
MGLLKRFTKSRSALVRLPTGSFTADEQGRVVVGTLPSSFPPELASEIAQQVRAAFREASDTHLPLSELIINYPTLKITARELRGGVLVFLAPKAFSPPPGRG